MWGHETHVCLCIRTDGQADERRTGVIITSNQQCMLQLTPLSTACCWVVLLTQCSGLKFSSLTTQYAKSQSNTFSYRMSVHGATGSRQYKYKLDPYYRQCNAPVDLKSFHIISLQEES